MKGIHHAVLFPALWPLGTSAPVERRPWATFVLIAVSLILLALNLLVPVARLDLLLLHPKGHPGQFFSYPWVPPSLLAGLIDLAFFWTFAPALESRLGTWRLLLLCAVSGALGGLAHQEVRGASAGVLAGGAGVIMGLIGATIVIFPHAFVRVYAGLILLVTPLFARVLRVPVLVYALLYVALTYGLFRLAAVAELPYLVASVSFSPGALLGGLVSGAALSGLMHRQPTPSLPAPRPPVGLRKPDPVPTPPAEEGAAEEDAFIVGVASRPESEIKSIESLFGSTGDSLVVAAPIRPAPPVKPKVVERNPEDTDSPIRLLDQTDPPSAQVPAVTPDAIISLEPGSLEIPDLVTITGPAAGGLPPQPAPQDIPSLHEEPPMPEPAPQPIPATSSLPPELPGDEAMDLQLETSEDTLDRALALKDDTAWPDVQAGRFSVILAPGRPRKIASIVTLLADAHNLSLKGAYQALRHRHGILADNVSREEAERLAARFAQAGHAVLIAALTSRINFGGGLDLISIQEHGEHILFTSVAQMIRAEWRQIVFLAGGRVTITPGAKPRTVMDLFLVKPRHHLRLWDNSFSYSVEMPKFRAQAARIMEQAGQAIHTRSLDKWIRNAGEPLHPFDSMIEYDNYVRWHLLAHLAPTRMVNPS